MTIKQTKWSPDTCDCVLVYEWDTEEVVDVDHDRTLTPIWTLECKLCSIHQKLGHSADKTLMPTILEENKRKNRVYGILLRDFNIQDFDVEEDYQWAFDANRKLIARLRSSKIALTGGQLNRLRTTLQNELGGIAKITLEVF